MKNSLRLSALYSFLIIVGFVAAGCHTHQGAEKQAEARPAPLPLDLSKGNPNELGVVPILEYHELGDRVSGYEFPISGFRKDMERLYKLGYRPISLHDFVTGHIDVPAGKSPVVITFDDALRGQVDFDSQGQLSPNCAAGVLEDMHAKYPDWPLRAVFFVLPMKGNSIIFYQKAYSKQKLEWLVSQGFEVGNHTMHHLPGMHSWPDSRVEAEFAGGQKIINSYLPDYHVDLLALPFGVYPKNINTVIQGTSGGVTYHNICAMLAGYNPAVPPASKIFKPYLIPRIIPGTKANEIDWWLDFLEKHRAEKYISDGDPNTVTVPTADKGKVMMATLEKNNLYFRTYTPSRVAKKHSSRPQKPLVALSGDATNMGTGQEAKQKQRARNSTWRHLPNRYAAESH